MRAIASNATTLGCAAWEALGTSAVLRVSDPEELAEARAAVERELAAIDLTCSRFRPDSELARLNARAGRSVRVSPLLMEALELALRAAELTSGDVDPTVGRALELAGYDRDWRLLDPATGQPEAPLAIAVRVRSGWSEIALDRARASVTVPAGVKLDLGASAKAWAADRAAAAAHEATGCGVLVSLGGDIATAGDAPGEGWAIRVTDDHRSHHSAPGQTISIGSGGLATSSTAVRRWSHGGHTMHHIIDPRTGAPVRSAWRTVSVAAASCADANIAATAALVRSRAAAAWLDELGLPARLVAADGGVIAVGAWPQRTDAGALAA
ncbi:MAG TPA: FAD:protein FMN transferase [Solirubrobacteraceae bacterium]|jgi:thiamine biosynthesis lipoprotein ApbE|nr:FAD:protein FMN transferase [Solirubrobacteraceae bacterium]